MVAAFPLSIPGSWKFRMWARRYLIAEVSPGVWMRVSGLVGAEWKWLNEVRKEPLTSAFLETYLKPGMKVVDIGANVGYFTAIAAARVQKQGLVVCFEPTPDVAARLRENIALNEFDWVEAVEAAITDTAGSVSLYAAPDDAERNSLCPRGGTNHAYTVKGLTLDDYFRARHADRIDFIKIDAEGAEPRVLRGAADLIRRDRPDMLIEINSPLLRASGSCPDEVFNILAKFEYQWRQIESFDWEGETALNIFAYKY